MDTTTTKIEEDTFQEALDAMPEEVRDYMWGPAFDYAIDVAEKVITLSSQEKEYVRDIAYDLLMRLIDMDSAANILLEKKVAPEKVSKIMYYIDQEILESARNLVNYYGDINEIARSDQGKSAQSNESEQPPQTVPDTFSRLSQSFTTPSAIIPKKSVYTDLPSASASVSNTPPGSRPLSEAIPKSDTSKPAVDPYRLDPNEK